MQTGLAGGAMLAAGASIVRPSEIVVERVIVPLPALDPALDGFTIAQLSDFHYDAHFDNRMIQAAVEQVNALKPDLVVLTGDFVSVRPWHERDPKSAHEYAQPCAHALSRLRARLGVFAVLGNHDNRTDPRFITRALETEGITVLLNRAVSLSAGSVPFFVAGVNDPLHEADDLDATFAHVPQKTTVILLAHEPDYADDVADYSRPVQLQLSGHSHGGQIRIPGPHGPIAPYLPDLGQKYPWGLRKVRDVTLYTNRGIGTLYVPSRVFCPPEITLLTLKRIGANSSAT